MGSNVPVRNESTMKLHMKWIITAKITASLKHGFCYTNLPTTGTKKTFVSIANGALVGTLMTMGDVNDIFPICIKTRSAPASLLFKGPVTEHKTVKLEANFPSGLQNTNYSRPFQDFYHPSFITF